MKRVPVFSLLALWLLGSIGCSHPATPPPSPTPALSPTNATIEEFFDDVRREFSGNRAMEVVASMEPSFRVPGNSSFDASIASVVEVLESAGYVEEGVAGTNVSLTYRVEHREMDAPTWEPMAASLELVQPGPESLLDLSSNLNMVAINSFSTPPEGAEAEVVYVGGGGPTDFEGLDVEGKIVFGETSVRRLFAEAVQARGAIGVLSYSMPEYTQPEQNPNSIQFSSIPLDMERESWGLRLSYAVRERLKRAVEGGVVRVRVNLETQIFEADELTLVADVRGSTNPDERFVLSAHVQEPGANDNASGVAVQAEVARVLGELVSNGGFRPSRTISMVWGDEIISTRRYIGDDDARAAGILWGVSLDMVGENTEKTGGTFLIEKMPDPSTIWTRGKDKHTDWWGSGRRPVSVDDLYPHYLNDFFLNRCLDQASETGWVVKTNPYEGGSDHVPFLRAGIPGLLLWHFTDKFYHTDGDRLDKVSAQTMANVGVCTTVSAMTLVSADAEAARRLINEVENAALARLAEEFQLSRAAIDAGEEKDGQILIFQAWFDWYLEALATTRDIEVGGPSRETLAAIEDSIEKIRTEGAGYLNRLR